MLVESLLWVGPADKRPKRAMMRHVGGDASDNASTGPPQQSAAVHPQTTRDDSLMLRTHRLVAVRICLLIAGVALPSVITVPLAGADASSVTLASGLHVTSPALSAKRVTTGRKSSSSKKARCVVVVRARMHHKAGKSCVVKKAKTSPGKPGVPPKRLGATRPPSPVVASLSARTPASKEPASEAGSPLESPGGSSPPPIGPPTPDEPVAPSPIGKPVESASPGGPVAPVESSAPFRFFSPTSFWNEEVPSDAELDPSSAAVVDAFDEEIAAEEHAGNGPWINTTSYSVPVYTVPANQPLMPVRLNGANTTLASAWSAVPLPPEARPAVGADGDLFVWQPSTDRLWEFWRLQHEVGGWQASWGGAMQDVSSDQGVYGYEAWPGAQSWWGVSASSLSLVGGLISIEDLQRGQINHALEMAIPDVRAAVYTSPAKRSDGKSTDPASLPEGAHLRLNPHLNLATLRLPKLALIMAEAAQRYGIFIADRSSVATFYAEDPTPTGTNPYAGPSGYFEGKHLSQLLATFPWDRLELLKMQLHSGK